jgi:hypothetical protein
MTTFVFGENVTEAMKDTVSCALGAAAGSGIGQKELDKAYKMGVLNNYVPCADGDPIEAFVAAVEPFTVNQNFSFGAVQRRGRKTVQNGAGQATLAVGDYVVAFTQVAIGTAGLAQVKKAATTADVTDATPDTVAIQSNYVWRVIRILTGTGVAGDQVLIERV